MSIFKNTYKKVFQKEAEPVITDLAVTEPSIKKEMIKSTLDINKMDKSNAQTSFLSILKRLQDPNITDTVKNTAKSVVHRWYMDKAWLKEKRSDQNMVHLIEEIEVTLGDFNIEHDIETFILNYYLYNAEKIFDYKEKVIAFIHDEKEKDRKIIFAERIISRLVDIADHTEVKEFLSTLYDTLNETSEDWRVDGLFIIFWLKHPEQFPESILQKLTSTTDEDIAQFIVDKFGELFTTIYNFQLNTLQVVAKGVAIAQNSQKITLKHYAIALNSIGIDAKFNNKEILSILKLLPSVTESGNAEEYIQHAKENSGKKEFSEEVKIFNQEFQKLFDQGKDSKIFTFENQTKEKIQNTELEPKAVAQFFKALVNEKLFETISQLDEYKSIWESVITYLAEQTKADNVKEYINHMVHYLQVADLNDADIEGLI